MGLLATVTGCTSPAAKISSKLRRYGLDDRRADCVGERLQRKLSTRQLERLGDAAEAYRQTDTVKSGLTPSDIVRVAEDLKDPRIALTVGKAAVGCGIL